MKFRTIIGSVLSKHLVFLFFSSEFITSMHKSWRCENSNLKHLSLCLRVLKRIIKGEVTLTLEIFFPI